MTFVPVGPSHPNMFKTLNLLRLFQRDGTPVYFVVEGCASTEVIAEGDNPLDHSFYYDEHSCPTNYVPVDDIRTPDDDDPHGVFEYVRTVWMPAEYAEAAEGIECEESDFIAALFPEIKEPIEQEEEEGWVPSPDAVRVVAKEMAEMLIRRQPTDVEARNAAIFLYNCIEKGALSPLHAYRPKPAPTADGTGQTAEDVRIRISHALYGEGNDPGHSLHAVADALIAIAKTLVGKND